jgi:hypothetical protein
VYIWLVKKFFDTYPQFLQDNSILGGGYYFARSPQELSEKIAEQDYNSEPIILSSSGRWYVNVKRGNPVKRQKLSEIGKKAGLVEGTDWSWRNSATAARTPSNLDLLEDL